MNFSALHLPYQSLAVTLLVGVVAGGIGAKFMAKYGMGIVGDVIVGVTGAYIGHWLARRLRRSLWNRARARRPGCRGRRYRLAFADLLDPARLKEATRSRFRQPARYFAG